MVNLWPLFWMAISPGLLIGVAGFVYNPLLAGEDTVKCRPWLASELEESAFRKLMKLFPPDRFLVTAHMLLIDVVGRNNANLLSKDELDFAWKAHCDFVIINIETLCIDRVVEVNGPSHDAFIQSERDRKKDLILKKLKIPLEWWR